MHDTLIAKDIVSQARKHGPVKKIVVEVGDIAAIKAEELEEILKKLVPWDIEIKRKKAGIECVCGFKGEPKILERAHDFIMYVCPKCNLVPEKATGNKVILKKVVLQ